MIDKELEAFVVAARVQSFQKASEQLFISSTALIKQINTMEKELGLTLFHRTNKGIHLTESGKIFYKAATEILQKYAAAIEEAKETEKRFNNPIRFGFSPINPLLDDQASRYYYTPDCLNRFTAHMVPISAEYRDFIAEMGKLGDHVDIIPYFCDDHSTYPYCESFCIARLPMRFLVPVDNPLASKQQLCYDDLNGQEIFTINSETNTYYKAANEDIMKMAPKAKLISNNYIDFAMLNYAATYSKLVLVGDYLKHIHPLLVMHSMKWEHLLPYGLFYSKYPSDSVKSYIQSYRDFGFSGKPEDAPVVEY